MLEEDLEIGIVSTTDAQGRAALPVFTSEQALLEWLPDGSPWIALDGDVVLGMFVDGPWKTLVVDPGAPGFVLTRDEARGLRSET